jgi:hypothetical protein
MNLSDRMMNLFVVTYYLLHEGADVVEVMRLTHHADLLRDFGATQHVKRAASPTHKYSIS